MKFPKLVFIGDTVYSSSEVISKRETSDPLRGIVVFGGWRVATNVRTGMVLDAFELAAWQRGTHSTVPTVTSTLHCNFDAGSQFTSIPLG